MVNCMLRIESLVSAVKLFSGASKFRHEVPLFVGRHIGEGQSRRPPTMGRDRGLPSAAMAVTTSGASDGRPRICVTRARETRAPRQNRPATGARQ